LLKSVDFTRKKSILNSILINYLLTWSWLLDTKYFNASIQGHELSFYTKNNKAVNFKAFNRKLSPKKVVGFVNDISRDSLELHLKKLTEPQMEGRAVGSEGMNLAKDYISNQFKEIGLKPVKKLGLNTYLQDYETEPYIPLLEEGSKVDGWVYSKNKGPKVQTSNILGMIKGSRYPNDYVILTAHYDHLGKTAEGVLFPGADDNASSVSALIEIARGLKRTGTKRSVIFAAVSGEEKYRTGVLPLMSSIEKNKLKSNVEIIDIEMLGAKKGDTLDILKYKPSLTNNMVENMKQACEIIGTKFHIGRPGPKVLNNAEKLSNFNFPAVCVAWDYKGKKTHPYYHTSLDTFENVNKDVFEKAAKSVAALSYFESNSRPVITKKYSSIISRIRNFFTPKTKSKIA